MGVQLPSEPINRQEQYLAKIAGQAVEIPAEPITREEAYLDYIAKHGGGGGGTGDYEQLENLPQINNNTLTGNKSASDLGLASEEDLAGKQDVLTKGQYVDITNKVISVQRDIARDVDAIIATSFDFPNCTVTKTIDEEVVDTVTFSMFGDIPSSVLDVYSVSYSGQAVVLTFTNTVASKEHAVGYTFQVASYSSGVIDTQTFVETVDADKKLIIQSELDAAINAIKDGQSIDSFADVETALGGKADTDIVASDFDSTASYVIGNYCIENGKLYRFKANHSGAWSASDVDEIKIAGELSSLMSGLINKLDSSVYAQFGCKNLNAYPYFNTTKTSHDITFTDNGDGTVTATGQNDGTTCYFECHTFSESEQGTIKLPNGKYILNGCPTGGSSTTYFLTAQCVKNGSTTTLGTDFGSGVVLELNGDDYSPDTVDIQIRLVVYKNYNISDSLIFRPMLRLASVEDATWTPYVKSNKQLTDGLASVESGLIDLSSNTIKQTTNGTIPANDNVEIELAHYACVYLIVTFLDNPANYTTLSLVSYTFNHEYAVSGIVTASSISVTGGTADYKVKIANSSSYDAYYNIYRLA